MLPQGNQRVVEVLGGDPYNGDFCIRISTSRSVTYALVRAYEGRSFHWIESPRKRHVYHEYRPRHWHSVGLDDQDDGPSCSCSQFSRFSVCGHIDVLLQLSQQGLLTAPRRKIATEKERELQAATS